MTSLRPASKLAIERLPAALPLKLQVAVPGASIRSTCQSKAVITS